MTVGGAANFQDVVNALYAVKKNIRESGQSIETCYECEPYRAIWADIKRSKSGW